MSPASLSCRNSMSGSLSGPDSRPERRKLPFFSDLHHEISRSWKQPFSSRLTNAAAADFTNLVGSVEQSYTVIPVVKDILASHLSPSLEPSWKSRPLLPTKPCRTTSALIGKSYIAAGQAGMALHTMAILQAYQADVLKEMDFISLHILLLILFYYLFLFSFLFSPIFIYILVLCFIVLFFLHCPLSRLTYISLPIIPCVTYIGRNSTLQVTRRGAAKESATL